MIKLYNKDTNELLGRVSEEDLKFLQDQLEEESRKDTDYYITADTVAEFEKTALRPHLSTCSAVASAPGTQSKSIGSVTKHPDEVGGPANLAVPGGNLPPECLFEAHYIGG